MPWLFAPWLVEHCSGGIRAPLQYWPWTGVEAGTRLGEPDTAVVFNRLTLSLKIEFFAVSAIPAELLVSVEFGVSPPPLNTTSGAVV